jgi:hypothetical protein
VIENGGQPILMQYYEPTENTKSELETYTGKFYSTEFETTYTIYLKENQLYYHHPRHGENKMEVLKKDVIEGEYPFAIVKYKRDHTGQIIGVLVSNGRVRNAWFEKVK